MDCWWTGQGGPFSAVPDDEAIYHATRHRTWRGCPVHLRGGNRPHRTGQPRHSRQSTSSPTSKDAGGPTWGRWVGRCWGRSIIAARLWRRKRRGCRPTGWTVPRYAPARRTPPKVAMLVVDFSEHGGSPSAKVMACSGKVVGTSRIGDDVEDTDGQWCGFLLEPQRIPASSSNTEGGRYFGDLSAGSKSSSILIP